MPNFREMGMFLTKSALLLSLTACGAEINNDINAQPNATPIPQEILLGCRQVQFGDTGLSMAYEMGGDANSRITINGGEKVLALSAPALPLNEQHNIKPQVCVYDVK